jgi:hypothetical protein
MRLKNSFLFENEMEEPGCLSIRTSQSEKRTCTYSKHAMFVPCLMKPLNSTSTCCNLFVSYPLSKFIMTSPCERMGGFSIWQ